jgi:hypothetical protein
MREILLPIKRNHQLNRELKEEEDGLSLLGWDKI